MLKTTNTDSSLMVIADEVTPSLVSYEIDLALRPFAQICSPAIARHTNQLRHGSVVYGTEGFFSSAMKLLTSLANMVGHLFSTFKLVYRSFQGLKRTEIHSYQDQYFATLARVKSQSYSDIATLNMPMPKDLNTTYIDIIQKLLTCLRICDMVNRSKSFVAIAKTIESQMKSGNSTGGSVASLYTQSGEIQQINAQYQQVELCFKKGSTNSKPFGELFKSMEELGSVLKLLDSGCQCEYDISKVYSNLETCNTSLQNAVSAAKTRKNDDMPISKAELISLSEACVFMAKTFDVYGLAVQDFNRVEHNVIECVKVIRRTKKL